MKQKTLKTVIACCIFALAGGYLIYESIQSSWSYYYSVDEFLSSEVYEEAVENKQHVRLAGVVMDSGLIRDIAEMQLKFRLAGTKEILDVVYNGVVPKNFEAGMEVLVEGTASGDRNFQASKILTRCESKYQNKLQEKL